MNLEAVPSRHRHYVRLLVQTNTVVRQLAEAAFAETQGESWNQSYTRAYMAWRSVEAARTMMRSLLDVLALESEGSAPTIAAVQDALKDAEQVQSTIFSHMRAVCPRRIHE